MTFIAYIDEAGDTGDPALKGASSCFALGCVLVDLDHWAASFHKLLDLRRGIRKSLGIPMRAGPKANYLVRNSGGQQIPAQGFAAVTDEAKAGTSSRRCLGMTWEMVLHRLERMCTKEDRTVMVCHDDGENDAVPDRGQERMRDRRNQQVSIPVPRKERSR